MKKQVERLMFIAIGGLIAIIAYSLGDIDKDTATAQENVVDLIRCRKLKVIGKNGKTVASLDALETASRVYCLCECGICADY